MFKKVNFEGKLQESHLRFCEPDQSTSFDVSLPPGYFGWQIFWLLGILVAGYIEKNKNCFQICECPDNVMSCQNKDSFWLIKKQHAPLLARKRFVCSVMLLRWFVSCMSCEGAYVRATLQRNSNNKCVQQPFRFLPYCAFRNFLWYTKTYIGLQQWVLKG